MAERCTLVEVLSYPVKSLAGGGHDAAQVHRWGIAWDRRWMVVDAAGRFMTQREHPRMALLRAAVKDGVLTLWEPGRTPCTVPAGADGARRVVDVWRDEVAAADCGDAVAAWLTAALGVGCRLVHLADTGARRLRADCARGEEEVVSFADGFPVLLASRSSLADLNRRLMTPVPMSRFRPNLVVSGAPAWAEDTWRRVRIGRVVFRVERPCDRCVMTTIDQSTGERPDGNEPLATLGRFRRADSGKIMFGQNLVPESVGDVGLADEIVPLEVGVANFRLTYHDLGFGVPTVAF